MVTLYPKTKEAVLQLARWQLGYREKSTNKTKYGAWYGMDGQPWCLMFIQWVFAQCNFNLYKTASCTALYDRYKKYAPKQLHYTDFAPGDIVLYDWTGAKKSTVHCGIVESVSGDYLNVIEGNTAVGDDSNGGEVLLRVRNKKFVTVAIRPNYG